MVLTVVGLPVLSYSSTKLNLVALSHYCKLNGNIVVVIVIVIVIVVVVVVVVVVVEIRL